MARAFLKIANVSIRQHGLFYFKLSKERGFRKLFRARKNMINITRSAAIIALFAIIGLNLARAATDNILGQDGTIQKIVSDGGVTQMIIFEKDFDRLLTDVANGQLKGYIKSGTVKIYDGYAEVTAVAQKPITAKFFVRASITAENGKLYPKFLKMRYGFLPVPAFLMNFFIGKLAGQNYQNFQKVGVKIPGVEWQSVDFKKGQVIVEFKETNR